MAMIEVVRIPYDDVKENPSKFNSSNHGRDRPEDYDEISLQTDFSSFKHLKQYKEIDLPIERWMLDACDIGVITGRFPMNFIEDLDEYCQRNRHLDAYFDKPYFIRTESVSLKTGCHEAFPYSNIRSVIESITTSSYCHKASIKPPKIKLYLVEPVSIDPDLEFRVFVHHGKVTAISQQHLYVRNKTLNDNMAKEIAHKIIAFTEKLDVPVRSYVTDLALMSDGDIYFIELNPFGSEYGSGSSLFHWLTDNDLLYGRLNHVEMRYTV
jgi:D123